MKLKKKTQKIPFNFIYLVSSTNILCAVDYEAMFTTC